MRRMIAAIGMTVSTLAGLAAHDVQADGLVYGTLSAVCEPSAKIHLFLTNDSGVNVSADVVITINGAAVHHPQLFGPGNGQVTDFDVPEGATVSATLSIDTVLNDSLGEYVADCVDDGTSSATIELVCPGEGSDQDIFVRYSMEAPGMQTHFEWIAPGGTPQDEPVSNDVFESTNKVAEDDEIDVWIRDKDHPATVFDTLKTVVDCDGSLSSGGGIPATGGSVDVAWWGTALMGLGVAFAAFARRRSAIR